MYSTRGRSVVDYMMVHTIIYDTVTHFEVITQTESDHFLLTCQLDCKLRPRSMLRGISAE